MKHEDYPENFEQFITRLVTEQDCCDYIVDLRAVSTKPVSRKEIVA